MNNTEPLPPKLLEFVTLPEALPGWAKELRVWYSGTTKLLRDGQITWIDAPAYMISIACNLVRAKLNFHNIYSFINLANKLNFRSGSLESNVIHGKFYTIYDMCEIMRDFALQYTGLEDSQIQCSVMPHQGSPWNFDQKQTYYFSSKKRKMIKSTPPPIKTVASITSEGEVSREVIDWCKIKPRMNCSDTPKELALTFSNDKHEETYIASHCFKNLKQLQTALDECNGLLMPSIGVGLLPSTNFGAFVLIADPLLVLEGLKPYRSSKGEYPVHVYKTDTWTTTTSLLMGQQGVTALAEWTGNDTGNQTDDFSLLLKWEGGGPSSITADPTPLRNTKQLISRLQIIRRKWNNPDLDPASVPFDSQNYYPYLEAKVNGVTPFKCFTAAFCPIDTTKEFRKILQKGGFTGSVYGVSSIFSKKVISSEGYNLMSKQQEWDYGWSIRNILLKLVRDLTKIHTVIV